MRNCSAGGFCFYFEEEQIHSGQCSILSYMVTLLLFAISVFFFLSFSLVQAIIRWKSCLNCCSSFPWTSTRLTLNRRGDVYKGLLRQAHTERSTNTQHGRVEQTWAWKEIIYHYTNRTCVGWNKRSNMPAISCCASLKINLPGGASFHPCLISLTVFNL